MKKIGEVYETDILMGKKENFALINGKWHNVAPRSISTDGCMLLDIAIKNAMKEE